MITAADITTVIPAYNAEKYLAEAVNSVRGQSLPGVSRIIVVNDGSEDSTAQRACGLNVELVNKSKGGAASARNVGLRMADTSWMFFLDADDVLLPDALAKLAGALDADGNLCAVFGMAQDFVSPELSKAESEMLCPKVKPYSGVMPGCALIRRDVFEVTGPFDENLPSGELVAWIAKLRDTGLPIAQLSYTTLMRRLHLTNTGRTSRNAEMSGYAAIIRDRLKRHGQH